MGKDFVGLILLVTLSVLHGQASRGSSFGMILMRWPGVLLHEVAHLLLSAITFSKPTSFTIWPRREGNVWILGCVTSANIGMFSAMLVGFAPAIVGLPLAWMALQAHSILGYVGVFVCLTASVPSEADIEVAFSHLFGSVVWAAVGITAWAQFGNLGELLTLF